MVEEKVDQLHERLESLETHVSAKLDRIIEGQQKGRSDQNDLRTKLETLSTDVKAMKPHVQTVSDAKVIWRAILLLAAISGTIAGAVGVAWGYIKPIFLQSFWK